MLKIRRKRTVYVFGAVFLLIMPVTIFVMNRINAVNNTNALTYTIPEGYTTITDPNFYNCVIAEFTTEFPNEEIPATGLTDEQLSKISKLICNRNSNMDKIINVNGLEKMVSLTNLELNDNDISEIDISTNTVLQSVYINDNKLESINSANHPSIKKIIATGNTPLVTVNVANTPTLELLNIGRHGTLLSSVDVSGCTNLQFLYLSYFTQGSEKNSSLTELDLSDNVNLESLDAYGNNLSDKDIVVNNTKLKRLHLGYANTGQGDDLGNNFSEINLSNNTLLESVYLTYNKLESLDVTNLTNLKELVAPGNDLTSLDLSNNAKLEYLDLGQNHTCSNTNDLGDGYACSRIAGNAISFLDLSYNPLLSTLKLANNRLKSLDLSAQTALEYLDLGNNELSSLDLSNQNLLTYVNIGNNARYTGKNNLNENTFKMPINSKIKTLWAEGNSFSAIPNNATSIWYASFAKNGIAGVFTTETMPELKGLYIDQNEITNIDISGSPNLVGLSASKNNLTEFDVSNNGLIRNLNLAQNSILDFSTIEGLELGGEYDCWSVFGCSGGVQLREQKKNIETNSNVYQLPPLFSQVKTEGWGSRFDRPMFTEKEFKLQNAVLSEDGKAITIIDLTKPASIKIDGGVAGDSMLVVKYVGPEPTVDSDIPVPDTSAKTPNSGASKGDFNSACMITEVMFGAFIVIMTAKKRFHKKIDFKKQ